MFSRKIAVQMSGILSCIYACHVMSLNAFASQAAINAMIMGRFTAARIYKFLLSEPGARLCSESRSSLSALGKFIGLSPFPPTRKS